MRFLCDEMLGKLGRWLRAAGHDTVIAAPGSRDRDLLARAVAEERTLLTRDRNLAAMRGASGTVLVLTTDGLESWVAEIAVRLGVDWLAAPFSRCLVCNTVLEPAPDTARATLPWGGRGCHDPLMICPGCHRLYWQGSHVIRMRRRLEVFAGNADKKRPA